MFTPRRYHRTRLQLSATIDLASPDGRSRRVSARTLDLSEGGVGVAASIVLPVGQTLKVALEEKGPGHRRVLCWDGRVVNVRDGSAGPRLGIQFLRPEAGPTLSYRMTRADQREVSIRLDPPWGSSPEPEEEAAPAVAGPGLAKDSPPSKASRLFQWTILLGFLADQLVKVVAISPGQTAAGSPGRMTPADLIVVVLLLGLLGTAARWALRSQGRWGRLADLGWGCLIAGLLGNTVDQLSLGQVRAVFPLAPWVGRSGNLADALALFGVLILSASWLAGRWARRRGAIPRGL